MGIVCCRSTVGDSVEHLTPRQGIGEAIKIRMDYWGPTAQ